MKTIVTSISLLASAVVPAIAVSEPLHFSLRRSADGIELSWLGTITAADGSTPRPYFELQSSLDL